jgi:hypothetical protein
MVFAHELGRLLDGGVPRRGDYFAHTHIADRHGRLLFREHKYPGNSQAIFESWK